MTRTAAAVRIFHLPDLGEGLVDAEVLRWLVAPGDRVERSQPLVEVETAKAAVEIPSPWAGVVAELHAAEGDEVAVGAPLVSVDTSGAASGDGDGTGDGDGEPDEAGGAPEDADGAAAREPVLVGYGVRTRSVSRRPRRDVPPPRTGGRSGPGVRATPPVRRFARDAGVDLQDVRGTGPGGRVTRDDVTVARDEQHRAAGPAAGPSAGGPDEVRTPVRGVRRATVASVVRSASTVPHVTEFLDVDVTASMDLRRTLDGSEEVGGLRVTPLALAARAFLLALRRSPEANASYDEAADEIVVRRRVGLGIAAATDRGLLVPVVHDADGLSFPDLVRALAARTAAARDGSLRPEHLQGVTATITNVGSFGVDTGTPLLPPGTSVILALGAVRPRPWVVDGELAVRDVVTLALSFDHRVVDGDLGGRVLTDTAAVLADPRLALVRC